MFDFRFLKEVLGLFLLITFAIIGMLLLGPGCATAVPNKVMIQSWVGDSSKVGLVRAQEQKEMLCTDKEFDEMICVTGSDLQKIFDALESEGDV
jgi:hypothetical protein